MQYDLAAPRPMRPRSWCNCASPKRLGMLDHHDGGVRHINADFDHRGRYQDLQFALLKHTA